MNILTLITTIFFSLSSYAQNLLVPGGSTVQNISTGKVEKISEDKNINLTSESPVVVQTKGGVPLLVLAANSTDSKIDIKKIDLKSSLRELVIEDMNSIMNEITKVHVEVQGLIQKRNLVQAADRVKDLQNKYPGLALGYFLEGTVQYLLGNKELATKSLEQGLAIDSKDENARKLLHSIKGGSR